MRDKDIRSQLHIRLAAQHSGENNTLILDELAVCQGVARVDVAVVNGLLSGYEIKSDRDTLERLPVQRDHYNKAFDRISIVSSSSHLEEVKTMVPEWWELIEASGQADQVELTILRPGKQNPNIDPFSVAQFLWRDEAFQILEKFGLAKGCSGKPRKFLWERLAKSLELKTLQDEVRHCLKIREDWRSDPLQQ